MLCRNIGRDPRLSQRIHIKRDRRGRWREQHKVLIPVGFPRSIGGMNHFLDKGAEHPRIRLGAFAVFKSIPLRSAAVEEHAGIRPARYINIHFGKLRLSVGIASLKQLPKHQIVVTAHRFAGSERAGQCHTPTDRLSLCGICRSVKQPANLTVNRNVRPAEAVNALLRITDKKQAARNRTAVPPVVRVK